MNACPKCRKKATAKPVTLSAGRFRHAVACEACGWSTEYARTAGVAEKLWNDAKPRNDKSP